MTKPMRLFIKVHNGFPEHPKTVELSDKAFRHLVELWCFCSRNLNDGRLTNGQAAKYLTNKTRRELVAVGFINEDADGIDMHDYLDHQQSAQEVSDLRERRAEAGSRGGKAKASRLASARGVAKQTPSKPVADTDTDTDTGEGASPSPATRAETDTRFDEFWNTYDHKVGRKTAEQKWALALKKPDVTADLLIAAAASYVTWERANNDGGRYIKHPTTWLNGEHWTDERVTRQAPMGRAAQWLQLAADLGEQDNPPTNVREIGPRR